MHLTATRPLLNRVPEVTTVFWIIKVLATTVGETAADYLAFTLNLGLASTSYIMGALLLLALANQFRLQRYVPANYWLVVVLISIVGTLITDRLVDELGVSLVTTTIVFSLGLAVVFAVWYANEKHLTMHSINTPKREAYYWLAILLTFALGTAAGDWLAEGTGLGYAPSLVVFASLIGAVATGYYCFRMNGTLAFWLAYILTRPLGASTGDLLSQAPLNGGLGFGTVDTSILFLCIILSLIGYLTLRQRKLDRRALSDRTQ